MTREDICAALYAAMGALDADGIVTQEIAKHAMDRNDAPGKVGDVMDVAGMLVTFGKRLLAQSTHR